MMTTPQLDKEIRELIAKHGYTDVVGGLARYTFRPDEQHHSIRKMGTAFRRLDALYEYLLESPRRVND